jgi:hypothetical protein
MTTEITTWRGEQRAAMATIEPFNPMNSARRWQSWVLAGLVGMTAVLGGLVLAFGGPLAALALLLAGIAGFIVLRDIEIGFFGVIAVVCLLPFATLPVDIGLTPTFLDVALGAVVGIWLLRIVTGQQRRVVTAPLTLPLLLFMIIAVFAFIFGLSNGPLTPTLLRKFAELLLSLFFVIVVVDYCRRMPQLERLVQVVLLGGAGAALIGIGLWLLPDDTANTLLNYLQRLGYPGGWVIRYIEENPALGGAGDQHVGGSECVGRAAADAGGAGGAAVGGETAVVPPLADHRHRRRDCARARPHLFAQRYARSRRRLGVYRRDSLPPPHSLHDRRRLAASAAAHRARVCGPVSWKGSRGRIWPHRCGLGSTRMH